MVVNAACSQLDNPRSPICFSYPESHGITQNISRVVTPLQLRMVDMVDDVDEVDDVNRVDEVNRVDMVDGVDRVGEVDRVDMVDRVDEYIL